MMGSLLEFLGPQDPRTDDFFLVGGWIVPFSILLLYFVLISKIGPALMKNRQAFEMRTPIICYNVLQIVVNTWLFIEAAKQVPGLNPRCTPIDKSNTPEALWIVRLAHCYYLIKVLDMVDTIFFVLRKKTKQVTGLHTYHHSLMAFGSWLTVRYYPGGQIIFVGLVNTFVHAIMYFYYLLTIWSKKDQKNLWWKKHLTQLQLVQHTFVFWVMSNVAFDQSCTYPKLPAFVFMVNAAIMIVLFVKFYLNKYVFEKKKEKF